jgi:hypothetical protein
MGATAQISGLAFSCRVFDGDTGMTLTRFPAIAPKGTASFLGPWLQPMPQPGTFIRSGKLALDRSLTYVMDWALYFSIEEAHANSFLASDEIVANFREHPDSKTATMPECFTDEKIRFLMERQYPSLIEWLRAMIWVRRTASRQALRRVSPGVSSYLGLCLSHPVLLGDRMLWGAIRHRLRARKSAGESA